MKKETKEYNRLFNKVKEAMKWDGRKVHMWFGSKNPNLGDIPPIQFILSGRVKKLEQFIDSCINENKAK